MMSRCVATVIFAFLLALSSVHAENVVLEEFAAGDKPAAKACTAATDCSTDQICGSGFCIPTPLKQASSTTAGISWVAALLSAPVMLGLMMEAKNSDNSMASCCLCGCIVFAVWIYTMLVS